MTCIGIVGARKYKDRQSVVELVQSLPRDSIVITSSCKVFKSAFIPRIWRISGAERKWWNDITSGIAS